MNLKEEVGELQALTSVVGTVTARPGEAGVSPSPVQRHLNASDEAPASVERRGARGARGQPRAVRREGDACRTVKIWGGGWLRFWAASVPCSPNSF